jgi:hypothetical protein
MGFDEIDKEAFACAPERNLINERDDEFTPFLN